MLLRIHPENPQEKNIRQVVECLKMVELSYTLPIQFMG